MRSTIRQKLLTPASEPNDFETLYFALIDQFYEQENRPEARKIATRLADCLADSPEYADSIRGEEVRSVIAELDGNLTEAIRCREAEIRKILELHALTVNTPNWTYVSGQYDRSDVSDRLDLLAMLYDEQGESERAIAVLTESKQYCESHGIAFESQELLEALQASAENE